MTSITLVLLPLFVLFSLQLEFLAYQDETVTWLQRLAIWLDVALITLFWPTILHPKDDWKSYWRTLIEALVPRRWLWLLFLLLFAGFNICLFCTDTKLATGGQVIIFLVVVTVWLHRGWNQTHIFFLVTTTFLCIASGFISAKYPFALSLPYLLLFLSSLWHNQAPRGSFALLLTLVIGSLLPLAQMVDGEYFEQLVVGRHSFRAQHTLFSGLLDYKRRLDLNEQLLFAKPPKPETLALIRSGRWEEAKAQLEPINLQGRNLRHADLNKAMLIGADLRKVQLQDANLREAELQGADLSEVNLRGADLSEAKLQGANLSLANLQGADLSLTNLQGADLSEAKLQGANLSLANLQGADLMKANLQGADLNFAKVRGADLNFATLQGANLTNAELQGSDLNGANVYAVVLTHATTTLIDAREVIWQPLDKSYTDKLITILQTSITDTDRRKEVTARLKKASTPNLPEPYMESILAEAITPIRFAKRYDPLKSGEFNDFTRQLHDFLVTLAGESNEIARGIIRQIHSKAHEYSSRRGLATELKKHLDDPNFRGLQGLTPEEKEELRGLK